MDRSPERPSSEVPLVSVIVCTYQHGPYIARCLESIKAQRTSFPIEVLVGQDFSSDNTGAECDRVAKGDPRFTVHHWQKGERWRIEGQPTGRRNFMRLHAMARGRYVHFIDGDDGWLDPLKLQRQVDLLESDPACMGSYHQTAVMDERGALTHPWRDHLPERMGLEEVVGLRAPFHPSSFIWRNTPAIRAMITGPGGWKAGSGDMWFFASAATQGHLRGVDGEMSYYTRHGQGLSSQGLFARTNIHRLRILQWQRLDQLTAGRWRAHLDAVCDRHLDQVTGAPMTGLDKRRWLLALGRAPRYFMAQRRWARVLGALRAAPQA